MIDGKRVLAIVPARGGSKGIPLKNLLPILGMPLVARVGEIIRQIPAIDRAVVSTDHEEIARVAEEAGIAAPFRRPEGLSGDRIADLAVLTHALQETERLDGLRYDIVLMLQPTSPLRRPEHIEGALAMLVEGGWDAVWTVSVTDSKAHPLKQLTVGADGSLAYYDKRGAEIIARQQLDTLYHRNGAAYAITRSCLLDQKSITGVRAGALEVDGPMVSIDSGWDAELVEFILSRRERRAGRTCR